MRHLFAAALAAAVVLASGLTALAQSTPTAGSDGIPPLTWELVGYQPAGGEAVTIEEPGALTVQFLPDGNLSGRADCNSIGGPYEITGDTLTIGMLRTTLVGCEDGSLGDQFTAWLPEAATFALTDDGLLLTLKDGTMLQFAPTLYGVVWQWEAFKSSDDSEVVAGNPARYTLEISTDGQVAVLADCNRGRGSVEVDSPMLTFGPIATTRMGCPADSQADLFLGYLEHTASYLIADGKLHLALVMDGGIAEFSPVVIDANATPAATPTS